jgi:hypothetical protein
MKFPNNLKVFVAQVKWTFAKTYASTWPHEYIVRSRVDEDLFIRLVQHIRTLAGNYRNSHANKKNGWTRPMA